MVALTPPQSLVRMAILFMAGLYQKTGSTGFPYDKMIILRHKGE
jgi:hypothetical protein